jgi:hypothetical protein
MPNEEEEEVQSRSIVEYYDSNDDDSISCFGDKFFMASGGDELLLSD